MLGADSWAPKHWGTLEQDLGQKSFQGQERRCDQLDITMGREVFGDSRIRPVGP